MTVDNLNRAFDVYRRTATSRSAIALIVANAIPLIGVLFFGWSLHLRERRLAPPAIPVLSASA